MRKIAQHVHACINMETLIRKLCKTILYTMRLYGDPRIGATSFRLKFSTFHRITWWSPEPFTIVLRFQRVPPIVSPQLARPDDLGVTHGHSSQTDARKPHHHC